MELLHPQSIWILLFFIMGYIFITIEHYTHINKATVAILAAVSSWAILFVFPFANPELSSDSLLQHALIDVSQVVFFLLGALTIVETINLYQGFNVITDHIHIRSKRKLLWVICFVSFFLSSVIDNLTTTIVMVTMLRKMVFNKEDRLLMGGAVVIAANAGGAWTPIGDVTTTMLWINGQISTLVIMKDLFIPSMVCLLAALAWLTFQLKGELPESAAPSHEDKLHPKGRLVFWLGIGSLLFVPFFKTATGLPPYMGIFLGLSILWLVTDFMNGKSGQHQLRVPYALTRIDSTSLFFFIGILLCVAALEMSKLLHVFALGLDETVGNPHAIAVVIGLVSAVVDNIPLVAASMGMYPLSQFPMDSSFWQLVAFCAGTGGSVLIIGSAAGVMFMGMEKVDFFWFIKKITIPALIGYFAGIGVYLLLQ